MSTRNQEVWVGCSFAKIGIRAMAALRPQWSVTLHTHFPTYKQNPQKLTRVRLDFMLGRSRGCIGRVRESTGAPPTAGGRSRRARGRPCEIPGGGGRVNGDVETVLCTAVGDQVKPGRAGCEAGRSPWPRAPEVVVGGGSPRPIEPRSTGATEMDMQDGQQLLPDPVPPRVSSLASWLWIWLQLYT